MDNIDTLLQVTEDGIQTHCDSCVFCLAPHGKQVGCRFFDRFDKFRKKQQLDYANDHFIVKRLCNAGRPRHWGEQQANSNVLEWRDKVQAEIEIDYDMVIVDEQEQDFDIVVEKLTTTCKSLFKSTILPPNVFIVTDVSLVDISAAISPLFTGTDIQPLFIRNFDEVIPVAISKTQASYLMFVESGMEVDINAMYRLNQEINYGLEKVVAVAPGTLNNTIFRVELYKRMLENSLEFEFDTLYDVITALGYEHTIRKAI